MRPAAAVVGSLGDGELVAVERLVVKRNLGGDDVLGVPGVLDGQAFESRISKIETKTFN